MDSHDAGNMRRREREKIIEKSEDFLGFDFGAPLYFRPFEPDDKKIAEISKFSGEKKSAVAQKLVHLALAGKDIKFSESRLEEKIDWLIKSIRQNGGLDENIASQLEDIGERLDTTQNEVSELIKNSEQILAITAEIFCMTSIAISSLNQIFTKLLEYLSPVEVERTRSIYVANHAMAALIEHSVDDLRKAIAHYGVEQFEHSPEDLYIFSKIGKLKNADAEAPIRQT